MRHDRLVGKIALTRSLYAYGYNREQVMALYRLVDWMIALVPEHEQTYRHASEQIETEGKMGFVLTVERLVREETRREMREEARATSMRMAQEGLRRQLTRRFGPLPEWAARRIEQGGEADILSWMDRVLDAASLENVLTEA